MGTMTVLMAMIRLRWCASIIDRWRLQKKQPQGTLQGDSVVFETVQVLMVYNIFAMVYITFAIQWCLQYLPLQWCSTVSKEKAAKWNIIARRLSVLVLTVCNTFAIDLRVLQTTRVWDVQKKVAESQNLSETLSRPWEWGCGVTDRCLTCQI